MKQPVKFTTLIALCFLCFIFIPLSAEDSFGFDAPNSTASQSVTVGGEVSAGFSVYTEMLNNIGEVGDIRLGNIFSGTLDFSAKGSNVDAAINLKLKPTEAGMSPIALDEAWLRAYFGKLDIEAGLRKLTWGKADSMGPLDVTNPLDLSDLTITDNLERKIARPMVHGTLSLGSFTRLEAVVIPSFEGHHFATEGRWTPAQVNELIHAAVALNLASDVMTSLFPDTTGLEYTQAGFRLTTSIKSSDLGFQYFYGNLPKPASAINPEAIQISYNRYHQIGVDYAGVLGGFNVRLEGAANITEDLSGDDGSIYNPSLLWSAGFDRNLVAGINLNLQGTGSIQLMHDKIGDTIEDTEAGSDMLQTKITAQVSKKILRDALELKTSGVYDIGKADWLIMPAIVWNKGDIEAEAGAGFFGGDAKGELGQYTNNDYLKFSLTYRF